MVEKLTAIAMPRAIWSGALSFGLVNIPVKLVSATSKKRVSFNQLHEPDHARIRYDKVCSADGESVPKEEIVKGYKVGKGEYVVVTDEELEAIEPEASRNIEVQEFVELADVDPLHFDSSYYLVPGEAAIKPYTLLRRAMEEAGRVGIARLVMRSREHLVAVRPHGDALVLHTMHYADEVRTPAVALEDVDLAPVELGDKEVATAVQLIDALSAPFEPADYEDEYRTRVLELVRAKAEGETVEVRAEKTKPAERTEDLLEALQASLSSVKAGGNGAKT